MGILGPDEPRYASIGREMARSGDWVTPRLWGEPWFEKPPLLYWMTGAAFRFGFSDDSAPRIGVALLSACFALFYWRSLRRLLGDRAGWVAVCILVTCAGWIAFSNVGATDLPLAATFGAAMLLSWEGLERRSSGCLRWGGAFFGLAVLAKGLVPLVLAAPLLWWGWRRWREFVIPILIGLAVALPWYVLMTMRHGAAFIDEFFVKHHFGRFATEALAHQRPIWFYVPVLFGGLFPWLVLLVGWRKGPIQNSTTMFLLVWAAFGLVFFSLSTNKLPGYLLPLLPAVCGILGHSLSLLPRAGPLLFTVVLMLSGVPAIASLLPQALVSGLSRAELGSIPWEYALVVLPAAITVWIADRWSGRELAVGVTALCIAASVAYLKLSTYPVLDQLVSPRPVWRNVEGQRREACIDAGIHRNDRYGLNYYSVEPLPDCDADVKSIRLGRR